LTKAARLQDQIRTAIGGASLEPRIVSIFVADPEAELGRRKGKLLGDVARLERLLAILVQIRTAVGEANAAAQISALLAEKAGLDEIVELATPLVTRRNQTGAADRSTRITRRKR
jgi:hypothetical protein